MSEREKDIIKKIAAGLPYLSEFDKGYFLGVAEAKASIKQDVTKEAEEKRKAELAAV